MKGKTKEELAIDIIKNYSDNVSNRKLKIYNFLNNTNYSFKDLGIEIVIENEIGTIITNYFYKDLLFLSIHEIKFFKTFKVEKFRLENNIEKSLNEIEKYKESIESFIVNLDVKYNFNLYPNMIFYFYDDRYMFNKDLLSEDIFFSKNLIFKIGGKYVDETTTLSKTIDNIMKHEFTRLLKKILLKNNISNGKIIMWNENFFDVEMNYEKLKDYKNSWLIKTFK